MKAYIVERALLRKNLQILREKAGSAAIYGVVKGNGYGLGLLPVAEVLWAGGVRRFAVAEPWEAAALREKFPESEILMLRETRLQEELRELMEARAVITVGSRETAELADSMAAEAGIRWPCHIKIDTGMGRYGFLPAETEAIAGVYTLPHLAPQGIYTHFHSAYNNESATRSQFALFQQVLSDLQARGIDPGIRHCCNSSAFLKYPEMHLDAVRLGSALLGRLSFSGPPELTPVGWCEAQVELVRDIPKGQSVGYNADWTARRPTRIAVVSVGLFHGFGPPVREYPATFKGCLIAILGSVKALIRKRTVTVEIDGRTAQVIGTIGMVQSICDVTDIPCQAGSLVRIPLKPLQVKDMPIEYRN